VTLYPGRPILENQVGPPALVERNQVVRMVFLRGGLAITAEGRALDRGGFGEAVRVMNLSSRQIVSGAVAADGSIEVGR
jgi:flagella basal body P-ring formation protein FlgA